MTSILTTLSHLGWHLYRACDLSKKSFDKVSSRRSSRKAIRYEVEKADDVIWNWNWNMDMDMDTLMIRVTIIVVVLMIAVTTTFNDRNDDHNDNDNDDDDDGDDIDCAVIRHG